MISEAQFDALIPGDKVQIVSSWHPFSEENKFGYMDKWLGEIVTVREWSGDRIQMIEDQGENYGGWYWNRFCIERVLPDVSAIGVDELI